jgi:hypothetical protein
MLSGVDGSRSEAFTESNDPWQAGSGMDPARRSHDAAGETDVLVLASKNTGSFDCIAVHCER